MRKSIITLVVAAGIALGASPASAGQHHHRAPNRSELALLDQIQDIHPAGGCRLEWDGVWVKAGHGHHAHWTQAWFEVVCAK